MKNIIAHPFFRLALTLLALLYPSVQAQECYFLPPGGPMRFGMNEVSRIQIGSQVGESPIWTDDGRIIAGAPESSDAGYRRGAVYVFKPFSSRLTPDHIIFPPIPGIASITGNFGGQLATSGPWIAARAQLTNNTVVLCMFEIVGSTNFVYRTNLLGTGFAGERLGDSVRGFVMHGRWIAAIRYGNLDARIFMFRVNDEGVWEKKQELSHPEFTSSMPNDAMVDMFGNTLVLTSPQLGNAGNPGRADVWRLDNTGVWNYETRLIPNGFTVGNLGSGLDVAEDRIFLGAPGFEHTDTRGGAIFDYKRINGQWIEESRITYADFATSQFVGRHVAYSDLTGEYLAEASGTSIRMFKPKDAGPGWKLVSSGRPGRVFLDWESPAGTIQTYSYGSVSTVLYLSVRAHQVLTGYRSFTILHEHGWNFVETLKFAGDPDCKRRPVYYVPRGAPVDDNDKRIGDLDGDGLPDIAEIYFGSFLDTANQLPTGLAASLAPGVGPVIEWARYKDPALLVTARAEWSSDLVNWSSEGITQTKVGEDAQGREIIRASLPAGGQTGYMRLVLAMPES